MLELLLDDISELCPLSLLYEGDQLGTASRSKGLRYFSSHFSSFILIFAKYWVFLGSFLKCNLLHISNTEIYIAYDTLLFTNFNTISIGLNSRCATGRKIIITSTIHDLLHKTFSLWRFKILTAPNFSTIAFP